MKKHKVEVRVDYINLAVDVLIYALDYIIKPAILMWACNLVVIPFLNLPNKMPYLVAFLIVIIGKLLSFNPHSFPFIGVYDDSDQ